MGWAISRFRVAAAVILLASCTPFPEVLAFSVRPAQAQQVKETARQGTDVEIAAKLLNVKRIYVDSFGDDVASKQLQAMVINALSESKKFIITENKEKADAVLRGAALEKSAQEFHSSSDATSVGAAAGGHSGSISGSSVHGTGSISGSESGGFAAKHIGTSDSVASTETINDARLAVRLVSSDGDVLWTSTKESHGAKYKGASADVADQVVKQLLSDLARLQSPPKQKESATEQLEKKIAAIPGKTLGAATSGTLGTVFVTSDPVGAEIYSDDSFIGNAPVTLKLNSGQYFIRAFEKDYKNWSRAVTVEAGKELHLTVTMERHD